MLSRMPAVSRNVDQPRQMPVGVVEHAGKRRLQPREQRAARRRECSAHGLHAVIARRHSGVRRHDAHRLLPRQPPLALDVPAMRRTSRRIFDDQVGRRLMRRMAGAERQPGQPRHIGPVGDVIGDEADRLVDQVRGQMIAVGVGAGRIDMGVVAHQLRRVLVGLGIHEAVEAVEAAAERPAVERPGGAALGQRRDVPLADHVVAIAVRPQHFRQRAGLVARSCRDSRDSRCRNWRGSRRRPNGGCARSAAPRGWSSTSRWCGSRCSAAPPAASRSMVGVSIGEP